VQKEVAVSPVAKSTTYAATRLPSGRDQLNENILEFKKSLENDTVVALDVYTEARAVDAASEEAGQYSAREKCNVEDKAGVVYLEVSPLVVKMLHVNTQMIAHTREHTRAHTRACAHTRTHAHIYTHAYHLSLFLSLSLFLAHIHTLSHTHAHTHR